MLDVTDEQAQEINKIMEKKKAEHELKALKREVFDTQQMIAEIMFSFEERTGKKIERIYIDRTDRKLDSLYSKSDNPLLHDTLEAVTVVLVEQ